MRLSLFLLSFFFFSCASLKKTTHTSSEQNQAIDTTKTVTTYNRETTITEKSTTPIYIKGDSISVNGSFSTEDTAEYTQEIGNDNVSVKTTVRPKLKNGKITGYDITSKANTFPKVMAVPINKTTTVKESGEEKKNAGVIKTISKQSTSSEKQRKGWGFGTTLAIFLVLIIIALALFFYKSIRK